MSDTGPHESDEHAHIRRILKSLPPVQASPDFEQRLHRTIQSEISPRPEAPRKFAIPVFAYSLLTLLVVTVVSYYTFFRSSDVPVLQEPSSPVERNAPGSEVKSAIPPKTNEPDAKSKNEAPALTPSNRKDESKMSSSPENGSPGPATQENVDREKSRQIEGEKEDAAPANEPDAALDKKTDKIVIPKNGVNMEMPYSAPLMKSAAAPARSAFEADIPAVGDSAALLDSLRRDSLRLKGQPGVRERLQKKKRPLP